LLLQICISCGCDHQGYSIVDLFRETDCTPPTLLSITSIDRYTSIVAFDEPIAEKSVQLNIKSNSIVSSQVNKQSLTITCKNALSLAEPMFLQGRIEDIRGNSTNFSVSLWANNPTPPTILINEFTTKGNSSNPDRVELLVISRGNLGGLTLYAGTDQLYSDYFIFPEIWVEKGTYLVVAFSEETNEKDVYQSKEKAGLSSNNGCLTLAANPQWDATILDAVLWGNHTTTTFDGFGSQSLLAQAHFIHAQNHWNSNIAEDSIDSTKSTSTRSFCRSQAIDTNCSQDWYICSTRNATFGSKNSEERYAE